jgi:hypothetical protein
LAETGDIRPGNLLTTGTRIGKVCGNSVYPESYLHFAIAFGATWETDFCTRPYVPINAGSSWISNRFFDPIRFMEKTKENITVSNKLSIDPR